MICFYCEQALSVEEYSQLAVLTLCCNPRQCFCFKCLLDPELIQQNMYLHRPFPCLTCKTEWPPEQVRQKRQFITMPRNSARRSITPTKHSFPNPAVYLSCRQPQQFFDSQPMYRSVRMQQHPIMDSPPAVYSQRREIGPGLQNLPASQEDFFIVKPKGQAMTGSKATMSSSGYNTQQREGMYRIDEGPTQGSNPPYIRRNSDKMEEEIEVILQPMQSLSLNPPSCEPIAPPTIPSYAPAPSYDYEKYCQANGLLVFSPTTHYRPPEPAASPKSPIQSRMTSSVTFFQTPAIKKTNQFFIRQRRAELVGDDGPQSPRFGSEDREAREIERPITPKRGDYFENQALLRESSAMAMKNSSTFFQNFPKTISNSQLLTFESMQTTASTLGTTI